MPGYWAKRGKDASYIYENEPRSRGWETLYIIELFQKVNMSILEGSPSKQLDLKYTEVDITLTKKNHHLFYLFLSGFVCSEKTLL